MPPPEAEARDAPEMRPRFVANSGRPPPRALATAPLTRCGARVPRASHSPPSRPLLSFTAPPCPPHATPPRLTTLAPPPSQAAPAEEAAPAEPEEESPLGDEPDAAAAEEEEQQEHGVGKGVRRTRWRRLQLDVLPPPHAGWAPAPPLADWASGA
mmetsp:Transcript_13726/g.45812  ORF Transcript_13726/g.45812 Transcript_13726/m.45812 type:complete len:155 (+) Transcript_13726:1-465(+)